MFARYASVLGVLLLPYALAAQPDAEPAYSAPLRELPWAQLNFLHTTDTHGWLGGHLQEPSFSGDWGDYVSFVQHLRQRADSTGTDLLLVDTGDRIEGNGLYDGSDPRGKYLFDVFKGQQNIDILCSGNHELYKTSSSEDELRINVPNFKDNYLASNLDIINPDTGQREPLAQRFRKFETKNQKLRVLAFGFLFDFTGNSNNTIVQPVEETVKEEWFQKAVRDRDVDLIVVIGHVGLRMPEYDLLFKTIRSEQWDTPIAFFGGHTHIRDYRTFDRKCGALESGRYLETIGFMSMDGISNKKREDPKDDVSAAAGSSLKFDRRYIDNNLFSLQHHSGTNSSTFLTEHGKKVSSLITSARKSLQLNKIRGCVPKTLFVNQAPYPSDNSIFSWLADTVMPAQFSKATRIARDGKAALIITNTGAVRFDIFRGPFTKDTEFLVSPFTSSFHAVPDVPLRIARRVLQLLNSKGPIFNDVAKLYGLGEWMLMPPEQIDPRSHLSSQPRNPNTNGRFQSGQISPGQHPLVYHDDKDVGNDDEPKEPEPRPGYTTYDDLGDDGDDTVHSPIEFFAVPNCIQASIGVDASSLLDEQLDDQVVDVVYNEFVEPWLLLALQYLGMKVSANDTQIYLEGKTMTNVITEWVEKNWKVKGGKCD